MQEFHRWIVKLYLNLDEGNLKEALYCSDMALYTAEDPHGETSEEELTRIYSLRAKIRELMGKSKEPDLPYDRRKIYGSYPDKKEY